jgi:hypothetical protein
MKKYLVLLTFVAGMTAHGDTIITPPGFPYSGSYANWDYGCQFEYGCGSDQTFGQIASSYLANYQTLQTTGNLTATMSTAGSSFAYSEVDDPNGNPLDFLAFDNGSAASPVTFTFSNSADTAPEDANEFATTVYNFFNPFTAYVSAYNAQGQLLGTTSAVAVEDDNEVCAFYYACYSAFVGVQDLSSPVNDIASVVITTTESDPTQNDWFAFGTVEVSTSLPEPGTLALILFGGAVWSFRRRREVSSESRRRPALPE